MTREPRTSRTRFGWDRGLVVVLAATTLILGIGTPLFQKTFLEAAFGLGTDVLWAAVIPLAFVLAGGCIGLGLWRSKSRVSTVMRVGWSIPSAALACILAYMVVDMAWKSVIGPMATIILPQDYSGPIRLTFGHQVQPSLETRGKNFTYHIPAGGMLHVDRGWIGLTFRFKDGVNQAGGPYFTHIVRANQGPLTAEEFDCKWYGAPASGIECNVKKSGPGSKADRGLK